MTLVPRVSPRRTKFPPWLGRALRTVLVVSLVASIAALLFIAVRGRELAADAIVRAPNAGRTFQAADDPAPAGLAKLGISQQLRIDVGPPSASLLVWIIEPARPALGTVLLLHGIRNNKSSLLALGRSVVALGYRAVLPDLRGQGRSSGDYLTYGVVEAKDLSQLVNALDARGFVLGRVGVVGVSYGAATAIELAAQDARVVTVVAIAPFDSLRDVAPAFARHYAPGLASFLPASFFDAAIDRAGRIGDFDPDTGSPLRAIAVTRARVLLIHGTLDTNIPASESVALHDAAPTTTRLILVENADHVSILDDQGGVIAREGMAWLRASLRGPT